MQFFFTIVPFKIKIFSDFFFLCLLENLVWFTYLKSFSTLFYWFLHHLKCIKVVILKYILHCSYAAFIPLLTTPPPHKKKKKLNAKFRSCWSYKTDKAVILCGLPEKGISALHKIFEIVWGCGTPIFDTEHRNFLKK